MGLKKARNTTTDIATAVGIVPRGRQPLLRFAQRAITRQEQRQEAIFAALLDN